MERGQMRDILDKVNEQTGRHYTEADIDQQVQQRADGTFGEVPSIKRALKTGYFTKQDELDKHNKVDPRSVGAPAVQK